MKKKRNWYNDRRKWRNGENVLYITIGLVFVLVVSVYCIYAYNYNVLGGYCSNSTRVLDVVLCK